MGKKPNFTPQEHATFNKVITESTLKSTKRKEAWQVFKTDGLLAALAFVETIQQGEPAAELRPHPLPYRVWGAQYIDDLSREQMNNAMRLPVSTAGALMPDAHKGYGLPIGGVLAVENAVIPYAVGVDIACRMMMTIYPDAPHVLDTPDSADYKNLQYALTNQTTFGAGGAGLHTGIYEHEVLDESKWQALPLLRELRKTAIVQLGTSGTGNHFVEWGSLKIDKPDNPFGLQEGNYLALLTHSGSRGVGYKIADFYSNLAMALMPALDESVKHLAWLSLDSEPGQEYWHAMHLAGEFASANHHIIHEQVAKAAGLTPLVAIENHHNFAWREMVRIDGHEAPMIVHRKGATPAGKGVHGIIPGTMADPGYLVTGRGNPDALNSASHGGGRAMSRTQAKKTITPQEHQKYLRSKGVTLIGGGLDEAPQAYKAIANVINAQSDLVEILGEFQPRLVRMASDEPPWKRKAAPAGIVDNEGD